ncbi:MAG: MoxR family ATPase [Anaerolineae bacterium]|nr:MoxR family ATPase [Anaerolineae bacterium]MDW8071732.1 MoxR family ATPase [Anaerolineae bacterium]
MAYLFDSIDAVQAALLTGRYIADRALATVIFLATRLGKPLFLEGEAGVGKTEVAKVLAEVLHTRLIRLQCYEGLDVHTAVYEWAYARQIMHLRLLEARGEAATANEKDLYSPEFLIARPLLQALQWDGALPPVLLIDEIDRADEEFESFLLEFLSDFQITIPEIGTIRAAQPPIVVITSNRTREVHDALKRRCLYHWIDYPTFEAEYQIVMLKVPYITQQLAFQVTTVCQQLRQAELFKPPGIAETLDWATALVTMGCQELDEATVNETLGVLLKYQDDVQRVRGEMAHELVRRAYGRR